MEEIARDFQKISRSLNDKSISEYVAGINENRIARLVAEADIAKCVAENAALFKLRKKKKKKRPKTLRRS